MRQKGSSSQDSDRDTFFCLEEPSWPWRPVLNPLYGRTVANVGALVIFLCEFSSLFLALLPVSPAFVLSDIKQQDLYHPFSRIGSVPQPFSLSADLALALEQLGSAACIEVAKHPGKESRDVPAHWLAVAGNHGL
ncbi:MAG: hypothetical protein GY798_12430 [Hyphomicrobiales bacterium]|nr:hypothetical protein [Hyphomicrobiales bacterium]